MPNLYAPSETAKLIAQALNLPKNTVGFTLTMRAGKPAELQIETTVDEESGAKLATIFKRYRLTENDDEER